MRSARSQAVRGNAVRSGTPGDRSILAGVDRSESKTPIPGAGWKIVPADGGPGVVCSLVRAGAATTTVPARPRPAT
ncbi:hypothetical protein [Amycolatopsis sp. WAC 04182]|uniref:hypothetical protein n=1 Tax=Amycolatopsis sp. WAC 04182 TaxID=2203198 RepID=UPI0035191F1B